MAFIFLKICIHVSEIDLEGRLSQNFDKGISFLFMLRRRWNSEKKTKQHIKCLPLFVIRSKAGVN